MNSKKKLLILALLLGIVAVVGNKAYLDTQIGQLTKKKIKVIVAKKGLQPGTQLIGKVVDTKEVPVEYAPESAIRAANFRGFQGLDLAVGVQEGDYIMENYFATRTTVGNSLSEQIQGENFRAVTISVDEVNSLARSVVTGDHVDIFFTFSVPGAGRKMTTTLLQNVPVIATGSYSVVDQERGGGRRRAYNTITVSVVADDALRLTFAQQAGKIHVVLRNSKDNNLPALRSISSVSDILSEGDQAVVMGLQRTQRQASAAAEEARAQAKRILQQQRRK